MDRGKLHRAGNRGGTRIQSAAKNKRKAQHVIDLIRIIGAASGDNRIIANRLHILGKNFRIGISERENQRLGGHFRDHLFFQHAGC